MSTLVREIVLDAPADRVWQAVRDFGAVHERLAPGFVVACALEGDTRVLTFANGAVAREYLIGVDEDRRRLAYGIRNERVSHYNASVQIVGEEHGTRLVWTIDLLPNELTDYIARQMDDATRSMKAALERH
jgi:carbon monoxide dehydrogenase subunit G